MLSIFIYWSSMATIAAVMLEAIAINMGQITRLSNRRRFLHWCNWVLLPAAIMLCAVISIIIAIRPNGLVTHKGVWGTLIKTIFLDY